MQESLRNCAAQKKRPPPDILRDVIKVVGRLRSARRETTELTRFAAKRLHALVPAENSRHCGVLIELVSQWPSADDGFPHVANLGTDSCVLFFRYSPGKKPQYQQMDASHGDAYSRPSETGGFLSNALSAISSYLCCWSVW